MIRSMTGYGDAQRALDIGSLRAEIKTVNHRFFNVNVRTPPGFDRLEHRIREWLEPYISRGHAHVVIALDRTGSDRAATLPELDMERARHYVELLRAARDELGLEGDVPVSALLGLSDLFRTPEPPGATVSDDELGEVVREAVKAVVELREREGARLREDMEERLDELDRLADRVGELAPARLSRERDRLRETVRELISDDDVDEDRLAREIAYLAEKWDVNEELVRLRSHVLMFRETLELDAAEPAGKRLSFVVQELKREANTIGAKANDPDIGRCAVAMKEEIERLREQVENVE